MSINDDDILENNENLNLTINSSSLPDDIGIGDPDSATVAIVEVDGE